MGRLSFTAQRVHRAAQNLYDHGRLAQIPPWHEVVHAVPPPEILTRPIQQAIRVRTKGKHKARLRSDHIYKPAELKYPEDKLRQEFFGDHPWELARPKIVVEDDGNAARNYDWSKINQVGKRLDGESVVQRQAWLMQHDRLSKAEAYDKARKEFYQHRHVEDIARRVAKEEAMAYGAYFGKGPLEIGMDLENKAWKNWQQWAIEQIRVEKFNRGAALVAGAPEASGEDAEVDTSDPANLPDHLKGDDAPPANEAPK